MTEKDKDELFDPRPGDGLMPDYVNECEDDRARLSAENEKLRAERDELLGCCAERDDAQRDHRQAIAARERAEGLLDFHTNPLEPGGATCELRRMEGLARELEGPARDAVVLLRLVAPHSGVIGDLDAALARYDEAQTEINKLRS